MTIGMIKVKKILNFEILKKYIASKALI